MRTLQNSSFSKKAQMMYRILAFVVLLVGAAKGTRAQVVELGVLDGMTWSQGWHLNEPGHIVGISGNDDGIFHAFAVSTLGRQAFNMVDLGTFGGDTSAAEEVNNSGLVVGYAQSADGNYHAFAWSQRLGVKVDLGTLPGDVHSGAWAVCDNGLIAGSSISADWSWRPVVWTPDRSGTTWTIHELNTEGLEQVDNWMCWGVNNAGQIVGAGWDIVEDRSRPVIWNPVDGGEVWTPIELETLPEYRNGGPGDINERGEVVGWVGLPDESFALPALWRPANPRVGPWKLTLLPTLAKPAIGFSNVDEINDVGDMVGASVDNTGSTCAVRWRLSDLSALDLLGYPGVWSYGGGVSNNGVVGGWYSDGSHDHAVIHRLR